MIQRTKQHQQGFTLVELMLAMAFVAALLLAVATTVIQMSSSYTHGIILNEINKASRAVSSTLTTDIQNAQLDNLTSIQTTTGGKVVGGRLCLGNYTYIWNTAAAWPSGTFNTSDPNAYSTAGKPNIYLVKVPDAGGFYCTSGSPAGTSKITYSASDDTDLIDDSSHDLTLQSLTVTSSITDANAAESVYIVDFVLSSNDTADNNAAFWSPTNPNNTSGYWQCVPPSVGSLDSTRCAVQQFSIAVRVGNGDNS